MARRAASKPRARARARRSSPRLPVLEQRHLDLLGLGLVALGVFLAFVLWGGWEGGQAGRALVDALAWTVGQVRYVAPAALAVTGALLVLRPVLPAVRPLRAGGACLFAALTLALAAGTAGLGPGGGRVAWDRAFVQERGGGVGEALYWAARALLGDGGAHIVAVFLFCAAVLLLTGASIAGVLKATGTQVAETTRVLRRPPGPPPRARVPRRGGVEADERDEHEEHGGADDQPAESQEPAWAPAGEVRATRTRPAARVQDAEQRFPDLFEEPVAARAAAPEAAEHEHEEPRSAGDEGLPADDEPEEEEDLPPTLDPEPAASRDEPLEAADEHPADPPDDLDLDPEPAPRPLPAGPAQLTPQGRYRAEVTDHPDFVWRLPPAAKVLTRSSAEQARPDTAGQERAAAALVEALGHFGVEARIVGTVAGPHITRYELRLGAGTKMSKVANLKDDLAYALAATDIRILAPIPGKTAVGVEVPNARRRTVTLGDVWQVPPEDWSPLTVWLGKDVAGRAIGADLAKMPHLLVAGTTGAGKSGCVNAMLSSILLRATPHEVRLVLVDPKQVELNHYDGIPHLLTPVITNPRMAANALQNLVKEMEDRYATMSLARTRSLPELNRRRADRGEPPLPYVLCVIDELADLMMVAPADVEDSIIRLAQKARAVGIHLVLATQSPRVDVITGMIKANVPSRIAFAVSSQTDSRVILDQNGAESLLGRGDMLFSPVGTSKLQRIQGAYLDEPQIERITELWRRQGEPELREDLLEEVEDEAEPDAAAGADDFSPDEDPLLEDAIRLVAEMGTASTSMLQRRLRLGYTRAGRLIDMLERRNVISGYEGSKPRQVLVSPPDAERFIAALRRGAEEPDPGEAQAARAVTVPDDGDLDHREPDAL